MVAKFEILNLKDVKQDFVGSLPSSWGVQEQIWEQNQQNFGHGGSENNQNKFICVSIPGSVSPKTAMIGDFRLVTPAEVQILTQQ